MRARPVEPEGFRSGSRSLLFAMAAVVASFVASTIYTQLRLNAGAGTLESAARAAPQIAVLSDARTELRRYELAIERMLAGPPFDEGDGPGELAAGRRALVAHLDLYEVTPRRPGEEELWRRVRPALARLDALTKRAAAGGRDGAVQRETVVAIHATVDELDDALRLLVERTGLRLARDAATIRKSQARADLIAFGLDGVSLALAVLASVLALRTLRRYFRLLERRAHELEHFALQIGHDIFNPLTPIAVALRFASSRLDDAESRRAIARGDRAIERIQRNVESLLAFARAGTPPHPTDQTTIAPLVDGALAAVRAESPITVEVPPFTDRRLACGAGVLTSLLLIFLRNAIRRSAGLPEPRIVVTVIDQPSAVRVEVADAGPPLSSAAIAEAFDPDLRGPTGHPGIALDRAMARRMAEVHRGAVGARAAPTGAVYWFELPRAE